MLVADLLFVPTGLLGAAFLTRQLGPDGYGRLTLATTLAAWAEWMILSAFAQATIKFVGEAHDWRPAGAAALRVQVVTASGGALALWLLAGAIARLLNEPALVTYLRLFALGIPAVALAAVHRQILIGRGGFTQGALVTAARWTSRLLLMVLLVELGLSVSGAILGTIGSSLIEVAIARLYVRPSFLSGLTFPVRRLWAYALPLFFFALSARVFSNLDLLLLKMLGGTAAQAGIYGAAQNLAALPLLVVLPLNPLLLSALSRTRRERGERAGRDIIGNAMRGVIGLLPFVCVIVGAAREIVTFLFGSSFLPVAPLLSVLIFGALARSVVIITTTMMTAAGKPAWTAAVSVPLVPLAIAGHLWSIPRWGALGASFVTAALSVLAALAGLLVVYRLWSLLPRVATVLRALVLCVPAYSMAAVWSVPGALLFVKLPAIGLLVLLGFLVLGEFSGSEVALARSLLSRRALSQPKPGEA